MECRTIRDGDGRIIGIACGRGRRERCKQCGSLSTKLCDCPLRGSKAGKTCDTPMCDRCATTVGRKGNDTVDYCRVHAEEHAKRKGGGR